jgi:gas vesicle protein
MEYPMAPTSETGGVSSAVGFGLGILCGAALGAVIAMLCAPKSGAELRRDVVKSMDRMKRQASSKMSDVKARGRRAWQAGREAFNESAPETSEPTSMGGEAFVR